MVCILFLLPLIAIEKDNSNDNFGKTEKAENIILMIPDNQAFSDVIEARILLNGIDGDTCYQEALEDIGYKQTRSVIDKISESPEDSLALTTARRHINNEITIKGDRNTGECADLISTVLELADTKGKATGIVVTSAIFNAGQSTSADDMGSFNCGTDTARRYIKGHKVDVIFGGGLLSADFSSEEAYSNNLQQADYCFNISELAMSEGYKCITNRNEMEAAASGSVKKVLGIFGTGQKNQDSGKTPELFRVDGSDYPDGEPTLPAMTIAAMNILENDCNGFLLVVKGTQVDRVKHGNDIEYLLAESLAFDKTVNEVLGWVNENSVRKNNTLVVILSDYDCVGMDLNPSTGLISEPGGSDFIYDGYTDRDLKADETIIFSQGPGNKGLNAALNNTDLFNIMESIMN